MKNRLPLVALMIFEMMFSGLFAKDFFSKQERIQVADEIVNYLKSNDCEIKCDLNKCFKDVKKTFLYFKSDVSRKNNNENYGNYFNDVIKILFNNLNQKKDESLKLFETFVVKKIFYKFVSKLYENVFGVGIDANQFTEDDDITVILGFLGNSIFKNQRLKNKCSECALMVSFLDEAIKIVQECLKKVAPEKERRRSSGGVRAGFDESGRSYHFPPI